MLKRVLSISAFCSLVIIMSFSSANGQWVADGAPVCTASMNQWYPQLVSDGSGGAIIVWQDYRGDSSWDVYAQRVDAKGRTLWIANGVAICDTIGDQTVPKIASDGAGGAIIAWIDARNSGTSGGDVYAQRISADGDLVWKRNGQPICTAAGNQSAAEIVSDDAGGAIVAWMHEGTNYDIYAQRIDGDGFVHWAPNGRAICAASGNQYYHTMIPDGAGGAILAWRDDRTSNYSDIYAQRVNASGSGLWGTDGTAICTAADSQLRPRLLLWGDGGAIITWDDNRSGWQDIYAQKVNGSGTALWATDGVAVCTVARHQLVPQLVSDGAGGAIIVWQDDRQTDPTQTDLYAQRIDGDGNQLWTATGVPICTAWSYQRHVQLVPDGVGGAIMTWYDARSYTTGVDVYAQRVDAAGAIQWPVDGVAACALSGGQTEPQIASDGTASAIITWYDHRSSYNDIYAQRIERDGQWGYPAPRITAIRDIPGDQGGLVELSWEASRLDAAPGNIVTTYTVWRASGPKRQRLGAMDAFSWELVDSLDATQVLQYTDTIATLFDSTGADPAYSMFRIEAHAIGPEACWESDPDTGWSVDNVAPAAPEGLAGEREYVPEGLTITWQRNGEPDFAHYAVYRGADPAFTPTPGNLVASPEDTMWFDGEWRWDCEYFYKVSALDIHGNESGFALLVPDDLTGVETSGSPPSTSLEQNYPNPFNPVTSIGFSIARDSRVSLRVYDTAGKLIRILVDEDRRANSYHEVWDGKDNRGNAVASGIYYYRLEAAGYVKSMKMVLVR